MNNSAANRRSPRGLFPGQLVPRLHDRVSEVLYIRHLCRRIDQAYIHWIRRFILEHKGLKTAMVYTLVLNRGGQGVHSPLDRLRRELSVESQGIIQAEASG